MAINIEPVRGGDAAPSRPRSRMRRMLAGLLAVTVVGVSVAALGLNRWSLNRLLSTCAGQEEEPFSDLEQVAAVTLDGTGYRLSRYSGCEEHGEVDPWVIGVLSDWRLRGPALNQLTTQGWVQVGGPLTAFRSPNREYFARVLTGTSGGATPPYIYFCVAEIGRCEPSSA